MTQHILTLNNYLLNPLTNLTSGFVKFFAKIYEAISMAQTRKAIALVKEHMWAQRVYRETFNELSKLSDRELQDIGICRGDIHWIAMEAFTKNQVVENPNLYRWV
jgi:uncharacterized protein YjiS (DUF1127 family)